MKRSEMVRHICDLIKAGYFNQDSSYDLAEEILWYLELCGMYPPLSKKYNPEELVNGWEPEDD